MSKQTYIKVAGEWKKVIRVCKNVGGVWEKQTVPKLNVAGVYKDCMVYYPQLYGDYEETITPGSLGIATEDAVAFSSDFNYVYFYTSDDYLHCYNLVTGGEEWSVVLDNVEDIQISADNTKLYVTYNASDLIEVNASTGSTIRTLATGSADNNIGSVLSPDGLYIYFAKMVSSGGDELLKIRLSDGAVIWTKTGMYIGYGKITITSDGGLVYLTDWSRRDVTEEYIIGINTSTKTIDFDMAHPFNSHKYARLSSDDSEMYITDMDGRVAKITLATQTVEWTLSLGYLETEYSLLDNLNIYLYTMARDGVIRRVSTTDGATKTLPYSTFGNYSAGIAFDDDNEEGYLVGNAGIRKIK
jgi:hypothetical protein